MNCLIAVIGPTAVGKTKLALRLALDFNCEIVNADSRQVYRLMDIGTAKPSIDERKKIPHHLIDIVDPDEPFSLALYKKLATEAIENIHHRGKLPLLVGGSGLYIWSIIEGWLIPEVPPNLEFRQRMESMAHEKGAYSLYQELKRIDPVASTKIMPTNLRRIIRALEICQATGQPSSQFQKKQPHPFPTKIIGLTANRQRLYSIIDSRVDEMMTDGLVNEVQELMKRGYTLDLPSMSGIGYRQIGMFLQNKLALPDAIQQIKYETHRFARRQYAWFHLDDDRIHWFDIYDTIQEPISNLINGFIDSNSWNEGENGNSLH